MSNPFTLEQLERLRDMLSTDIGEGELLEAADALIDAAERELWRPIADAPRDGRELDLWQGGISFRGYWSEANRRWTHLERRDPGCEPTHFRPLPPPPPGV